MTGTLKLDYAEIVRLYHNEGLSARKIAARFGCTTPTIVRALRKAERPARSWNRSWSAPKKYSGGWLQEETEE